MALQHLGLDGGVRPQGLEQLCVCHQPSWVLNQIAQHRKRLGGQQNALVGLLSPVSPKALIDGVQPKWGELLHLATCNAPAPNARPITGHLRRAKAGPNGNDSSTET